MRLLAALSVCFVLLTTNALAADGWRHDPEVSFYGPGFYGHRTACGLALTKTLVGVANRTLRCGTTVQFRYQGRVVTMQVVDRGPYVAGRQWDLTGGACLALAHCFTGPIDYRIVGSQPVVAQPTITLPPTDTAAESGLWQFVDRTLDWLAEWFGFRPMNGKVN